MESATESTSCQSQVPFVSVSSLQMTVSLGQTSYSANPTFVYHSTTLIFTPGNYSLPGNPGRFSVANIETFIMIGDRAQLEFLLSLSNIGYVGIHNLTFLETPSSYGFN